MLRVLHELVPGLAQPFAFPARGRKGRAGDRADRQAEHAQHQRMLIEHVIEATTHPSESTTGGVADPASGAAHRLDSTRAPRAYIPLTAACALPRHLTQP